MSEKGRKKGEIRNLELDLCHGWKEMAFTPGSLPSQKILDDLTRTYQQNIRESPLLEGIRRRSRTNAQGVSRRYWDKRAMLYRGLISGYTALQAAFGGTKHIGKTRLAPDIAASLVFRLDSRTPYPAGHVGSSLNG
jgi:hypothetical protein